MLSHKVAAALAVGAGLTTSLLAQSSPEIMNAAFMINGVEKKHRPGRHAGCSPSRRVPQAQPEWRPALHCAT